MVEKLLVRQCFSEYFEFPVTIIQPVRYPRNYGRDSSVGVATRYGLDGPVIESQWWGDFPHPSRPALGPTQPLVQWVPGLYRG